MNKNEFVRWQNYSTERLLTSMNIYSFGVYSAEFKPLTEEDDRLNYDKFIKEFNSLKNRFYKDHYPSYNGEPNSEDIFNKFLDEFKFIYNPDTDENKNHRIEDARFYKINFEDFGIDKKKSGPNGLPISMSRHLLQIIYILKDHNCEELCHNFLEYIKVGGQLEKAYKIQYKENCPCNLANIPTISSLEENQPHQWLHLFQRRLTDQLYPRKLFPKEATFFGSLFDSLQPKRLSSRPELISN